MSDQNNPRAFPSSAMDDKFGGMTLRDWFAGQALPATAGENYGNDWGKAGIDHARIAAGRAYTIADAMLEERKKVQP